MIRASPGGATANAGIAQRKSHRRAVHIITTLRTGGAEAMLAKLVEESAAHGWEALVVCLGSDGPMGDKVRAAGVPTLILGLSLRRLSVRAIWRAIMIVRRWNPTVVQGWMYHGNVAAWVLRALASPSAALAWNIRCSLARLSDFPITTQFVIRISSLLSVYPDRIVFNSTVAVAQHAACGFRTAGAIVIGNGFNLSTFVPSAEARKSFRERFQVLDDEVVIGVIARFHPMKDFPGFVEAIKGVLQRHPRVRVFMAGPGVDSGNKTLEELIQRAQIGKRVIIAGELVRTERALPGLDVFCLASAWGEAFPNIIGEAMACGVPCVVTDVGDSALIVADTGLVVPPRDPARLCEALLMVVDSPASAREELGAAARRRIERYYDISRVVGSYVSLYNSLGTRVAG